MFRLKKADATIAPIERTDRMMLATNSVQPAPDISN